MSDVIPRLYAAASGDSQAADLLPHVHDELRYLADALMVAEAPGEGGTCRREIRENVIFRVLQSPTAVVTLI